MPRRGSRGAVFRRGASLPSHALDGARPLPSVEAARAQGCTAAGRLVDTRHSRAGRLLRKMPRRARRARARAPPARRRPAAASPRTLPGRSRLRVGSASSLPASQEWGAKDECAPSRPPCARSRTSRRRLFAVGRGGASAWQGQMRGDETRRRSTDRRCPRCSRGSSCSTRASRRRRRGR